MLAMRPATPADQQALEALIQVRSEWMKAKQLPNWSSWGRHVQELASYCARRDGEMWVLVEDHRRIVGCTTILRTAAPWAWTAQEADQPAFYLNGTVTDPAERHRKLGTLIACWAVDRAAREGVICVRRDCTSPALARYYEKQQFSVVRRTSPHDGQTTYAFERKAQEIPELAEWLSSGIFPPAPSRTFRAAAGEVATNLGGARDRLANSLLKCTEAVALHF
ncbi:GNAT family N-acetyltransferase [Streptomyces sp. CJ_13]|uniref:GNAT family N-acetyltransferase n=1 Tax=Streptomyces sp. CJ_13 TaxID=2724943 RepID=UPI001BDC9197|nr:GNAT family N-acetyltransferase [Streptomyces sp. CJ_13]MBT1188081.1 GNAT family N-acetyltransferase [Streptomyces sp. CJ_13]